MSVRALTWSFNLSLHDMAAKAALNALADHADEEGICWPSIARIALFAGCDEKTARRALQRLAELGVIDREERAGKSDLFRLNTAVDLSQKQPLPEGRTPSDSTRYKKGIIPYRLKDAVIRRDGGRCLKCGETDHEELTADHVVAERDGGPTTLENLQTLCKTCNQKKGVQDNAVFMGSNDDPSQNRPLPDSTPPNEAHTPPTVTGDPSQPDPDPSHRGSRTFKNRQGTVRTRASASAGPDGPPRPLLPDSAKWAERLAGYEPWNGKFTWPWGAPPDAVGRRNPHLSDEQIRSWKARRDAALKALEAA